MVSRSAPRSQQSRRNPSNLTGLPAYTRRTTLWHRDGAEAIRARAAIDFCRWRPTAGSRGGNTDADGTAPGRHHTVYWQEGEVVMTSEEQRTREGSDTIAAGSGPWSRCRKDLRSDPHRAERGIPLSERWSPATFESGFHAALTLQRSIAAAARDAQPEELRSSPLEPERPRSQLARRSP
jgi:hypothetical protein